MYIVFPKMFAMEKLLCITNLNFNCCELIFGSKALPKVLKF